MMMENSHSLGGQEQYHNFYLTNLLSSVLFLSYVINSVVATPGQSLVSLYTFLPSQMKKPDF